MYGEFGRHTRAQALRDFRHQRPRTAPHRGVAALARAQATRRVRPAWRAPLSSEGLTGYVEFVGSTRDAAETSASSPVSLGRVFTDPTVARLYERRPPYPEGVFAALARRLVVPRHVLDAGAGTGALARRMTSFAERIDAVEPSAEMLAEGKQLPGGSDPPASDGSRAEQKAASSTRPTASSHAARVFTGWT